MCGIVGIVDHSGRATSDLQKSVWRMCEALTHRGPDDWGIVTLHAHRIQQHSMICPDGETTRRIGVPHADQTVVFGHRRLAIIDLSKAGHQPMGTADGRFWITYNGEIYNYRELRRELESEGVAFRSTSDTEVLLALYARERHKCIQRLRGMFAFAIWDEEKHELFMARDRFGIKPLYYARTFQGVVFSSELRGILSSGCVSPEIDHEAEITFLRRGCIPPPKTFYRNIQALLPGHWATWDGRAFSLMTYWSLNELISHANTTQRTACNPKEIADQIRHALIESTKAHMVSDVPVGIFLSGGIDSTAIVAAVRRFYWGPLNTFTIVFPGTRWDEGRLARQAAAYYATDHTELVVTKEDFLRGLDDVFLAMDQPTYDGVNTYFVAKAVRQAGGKVALSGVGGDEVLGGYSSFVHVPKLLKYLGMARRLPRLPQLASSLAACLPIRWAPKLEQLLRHAPTQVETVWGDYRALFADKEIRRFVSGELSPISGEGQSRIDDEIRTADNAFWSIALLEIENFMIPQLLRDSDVFTMCHGLELRTPFVDHLFLNSVLDAGAWSRSGALSHKIALFRHMEAFLPPDHLRQHKRTFTFPFELWFRELLSNGTASGLGRSFHSMLDKPQYYPFIEEFVRGKVHWSRIWSLYVLERFKRDRSEFPSTGAYV